jgi:peptidoglycan/xylan/chitin deacetylase (PgdA/CDA1 family)
VTRRGPLVLCYHATSSGWKHDLSVPPEALLRQLRVLLRWYRPIPADRVLEGGARTIHLTFDDAYRSVAGVLPALRELGVPSTIFACSDFADGGRPLAVPELAPQAEALPHELATMGWDELRAHVRDGVEIGSHTVSHARLTDVGDAELARELTESRARIEDELGVPCRFVAYPYGAQDGRVRRAARRAGYEAAFALRSEPRPVDRFAVPRVGIWRKDHLLRTTVKTVFAYGERDRNRGR